MNQSNDKKGQGIALLLAFGSLLVLYCINYFQRTAVPGGIFSHLQRDLGLNATEIAFMGTSFTCIYSLTQVFVGIIIDRFGGMRTNVVGGALFAIGALLFPLATSKYLMFFLRFCTGLGASTMFLGLVYEANAIFGRKNYAIVMGCTYSCAYFGGIMASLPFAWLIRVFNWHSVLFFIGVVSMLAYILFFFAQRKIERQTVEKEQAVSPLKSFLEVSANGRTWMACMLGTVVFADYFVILTVLGKKFLEDFPKMSPEGAARVLFCMSVSVMVMAFCSSLLSRLLGNRRKPFAIAIAALNLAAIVGMILAIRMTAGSGVFALLFCAFAVCAGLCPVNTMLTQEVNARRNTTLVTGLNNMMNYLGVALFSVFVGLILDCMGRPVDGVYAPEAYSRLFEVLVGFGVASVVCACMLPETFGKYLKY